MALFFLIVLLLLFLLSHISNIVFCCLFFISSFATVPMNTFHVRPDGVLILSQRDINRRWCCVTAFLA
jgi:glucan phosphoethanolaminetransferase (alkaline phosphatase superfamily)